LLEGGGGTKAQKRGEDLSPILIRSLRNKNHCSLGKIPDTYWWRSGSARWSPGRSTWHWSCWI